MASLEDLAWFLREGDTTDNIHKATIALKTQRMSNISEITVFISNHSKRKKWADCFQLDTTNS